MGRILELATNHDYTRYTSTLREAWRLSIAGLSRSVDEMLARYEEVPELNPDERYVDDPAAAFGIIEARRHRSRGITVEMFLGLFKCYRDCYGELVTDADFDSHETVWCRDFLKRCFDRVELGFLSEWCARDSSVDTEDLQAANRRLTNEKNKYLTIFESLASPVVLVDPDGLVEHANFAAARLLFGVDSPGSDYYGDDQRRRPIDWLATDLHDFSVATSAEVVFKRTWQKRTYEVRLARMLDVSSKFTGTTVFLSDVTDRRHEEERRRLLDERIRRYQNLESLCVLAGGVAHDFNNILMSIMGNADLALEDVGPTGSIRGNLEEIMASSRRAADLCRQMLAFSGRGRFSVESLDLSSLVDQMLGVLNVSVGKSTVVTTALAPEMPLIEGDSNQLRQALLNLVVNGSEAIGERGGCVTIATGLRSFTAADLARAAVGEDRPPGDYVFVRVTDDGCGMDDEVLERMFEPFFTTKFVGRGLGLAAVSGIVRGHKGAVLVDSVVGSGTSVTVIVPPSAVTASEHPAGLPKATFSTDGLVLLVDDEDAVRHIGSRMLTRLGFSIIEAPDGREAIRLFQEHHGDIRLVVLDLTMPHVDGDETLRHLQSIDATVPIVLSSGYDASDVTTRFAGRGLAAFLQKPYDLATLTRLLNSLFDNRTRE